jgi:hypothetical protein
MEGLRNLYLIVVGNSAEGENLRDFGVYEEIVFKWISKNCT